MNLENDNSYSCLDYLEEKASESMDKYFLDQNLSNYQSEEVDFEVKTLISKSKIFQESDSINDNNISICQNIFKNDMQIGSTSTTIDLNLSAGTCISTPSATAPKLLNSIPLFLNDFKQQPVKNEIILSKASKNSLIECLNCKENFKDSSSYLFHRSIHMVGQQVCSWFCSECNLSFESEKLLNEHEITLHGEIRKFGCPFCILTFQSSSSLKAHMSDVHHQNKDFICAICNRSFNRFHDLKMHLNVHLELKLYLCDICGTKFKNSSNLIRHKRLHTGIKPFICEICHKRYAHSSSLKDHAIKHANVDVTCKQCDTKLKSLKSLKKHFKLVHDKDLSQKDIFNFINEAPSSGTQQRLYHCTVCGKKFYLLKQLTFHTSRKHPKANSELLQKFNEQSEFINQTYPNICKENTGNSIEHEVVDFVSLSENYNSGTVMLSIKSDSNEVNVQIMNQNSTDDTANSQYNKNQSGGDKQLHSDLCQSKYNSTKNIKKEASKYKNDEHNLLNQHSNQRNPKCNKKCNQPPVKKYVVCNICNASFIHQASLINHKRTHSQDVFQCSICPKKYKYQISLKNHIEKIHEKKLNHVCSICSKLFYDKTELTNHLRTHTKHKPFRCFACDKRFAHISHLHNHEKRHTGERPHKCSYCTQAFIQKVSLRKHMKKHCIVIDEGYESRSIEANKDFNEEIKFGEAECIISASYS